MFRKMTTLKKTTQKKGDSQRDILKKLGRKDSETPVGAPQPKLKKLQEIMGQMFSNLTHDNQLNQWKVKNPDN